jgi:hypothetical protein
LVHLKPETLEEGQEEEKVMQEIEKQDPFEPRLKPISQDSPPLGYDAAWIIKSFGDLTNFRALTKEV